MKGIDKDDPTLRQEVRFDTEFLDYTWVKNDWILTGIGGFFYWSNTETKVNKPYKGDINPDDIEELLPNDILEEACKKLIE